jgi:demethylmenaquinone methyltransferase/2-methoxy-6-polyprenyl-1,4-benzoquinol methylase
MTSLTNPTSDTFAAIATRYDRLNWVISLGRDRVWRRHLVRALGPLEPGEEVLDVATGTGQVALEIARRHPGVLVTGLDASHPMLELARLKTLPAGARVAWVEGDACELPFGDGRFVASCISFGIRNIPDRKRVLAEMRRVTRPGGRVVILEANQPRRGFQARLARWWIHGVIPWIGRLAGRAEPYRYFARSVAGFIPPETLVAEAREVGLELVLERGFQLDSVRLLVLSG